LPPRLASELHTPLREALLRIGMSQRELARKLGVDRRQVGEWVCGHHLPVSTRRRQIARAVKAPVEELWPDAEEAA
jgi:transcriptional regulator with XRE-family HTH domain